MFIQTRTPEGDAILAKRAEREGRAAHVATLLDHASDVFLKLWSEDGDHMAEPNYDEQAGSNLYQLFANTGDLAACLNKHPLGSDDAKRWATWNETYWSGLTSNVDTLSPLNKLYGEDNGKKILHEIKELFTIGLALLRGDDADVALNKTAANDQPTRPQLPDYNSFKATLSQRVLTQPL